MTVRAILVVRRGGYVTKRFSRTDYIVVAISAQSGRVDITRSMAKDAGSKSTRGMANPAILDGWQMVARYPTRRDAMAGITACGQHGRIGMVNGECWNETVGIMATTTIGTGYRVCGNRGRLGGCVNTVGFIVA